MKKQNFPIKEKIRFRLFGSILIYTAAGLAAMLFLEYVSLRFADQAYHWLYPRMDIIYFFYLIIGLSFIFYHYWRKPWDYLDEVVTAARTVYEQSGSAIELSEPLREVEQQMNQIKMSVLHGRQALKEAEDRKNDLIMYLAHDIRTPLTAVIGYLSLLEEAPDMPADQKAKYVGIALDKAERLKMLTDELFEITRYHTAAVRLNKTEVDLYALLAQVIEEFYPVLSARGNTVKVSAGDDLVVTGDPDKLARVFNNLLKNAAAYSYPDTEISISAEKEGKYAVVVFKNHGQTLSVEQLSGIFEKFNRLEEARLSDTGGAGLGLSIAKEIVSLHGGGITAQSSDETVTFTVTLPFSSS